MKSAHEIVQGIVAAGGSLWFDGYRVRGRNIPRRLAVLVKADEGGILAAMFSKQPLVAPLPSESMDNTTQPTPMQHSASMAPQPPPAAVTCGSCARFQPGPQQLSIGRCLAAVDGSPPKDQRGYRAAYPMAQRQCPEYAGVQS